MQQTNHRTGSSAEAAYGAWHKALSSEYFSAEQRDRPVVLCVDDEASQEIKEKYGLGTDLEDAVRPKLALACATDAYGPIARRPDTDPAGESPPATLPLLAVSVLAATRMERSGKRGAPPYYDRLTDALDPTCSRGQALQNSYPQIVEMWKGLRRWMQNWGGRYGLCTLPESPHPSRIGYSLSQALIRKTDAEPLGRFFRMLPAEADGWDGHRLFKALLDWNYSRQTAFPSRFTQYLEDESLAETWADLLHSFGRQTVWKGKEIQSSKTGKEFGRIRLRLDSQIRNVEWIVELLGDHGSGTPEFDLGGQYYTLHRIAYSNFLVGLEKVPVDSTGLRNGFALSGPSISLERSGASVIPLCKNPYVDGFVEADGAQPFTECCLLVHSSAEGEVNKLLDLAAPGWKQRDHCRIPCLPSGWSLYVRLRFSDSIRLRKALDRSSLGLTIAPTPQPKLRGGLRIARYLGPHEYLAGGEPDLLVTDSSAEVLVKQKDGDYYSQVWPDAGVLRLHRLGLPEGQYTAAIASSPQLRFISRKQVPQKDVRPSSEDLCGFPITNRKASTAGSQVASSSQAIIGALSINIPNKALQATPEANRMDVSDRTPAEALNESCGDVLLRWISETGADNLSQLREGVEWYIHSSGLTVDMAAPWRWIRTMSALGYIDVDWVKGRWSCAPLTLVRLPGSDDTAFVTGARRYDTWSVLHSNSDIDSMIFPDQVKESEIQLPESIFVRYKNERGLAESAGRIGATDSGCFAKQYMEFLPELQAKKPGTEPPFNALVECYIPPRGQAPGSWHRIPSWSDDGLYRWRRTDGRRDYRLLLEGEWYSTDAAEGVYLELQRSQIAVLTWIPEQRIGSGRVGCLAVPRAAPLPPLQARMAALCSGSPPIGGEIYKEVPWECAEAIAISLDQQLTASPQKTTSGKDSDAAVPPPSPTDLARTRRPGKARGMKLGRKSFSAEEAEEILQRLAIQYRNPNSIGYQCVSKALTHLNDPRFGLDRETQNWLEFAITALGRTGRTQKR